MKKSISYLLILVIGLSIGCKNKAVDEQTDVVLVGAGVMSATLDAMMKTLNPKLKINIYERLDLVSAESSDAWNNAGTGHSAFCELNYTPERPDGTIEFKKAVSINEQFEISKQFWAYMVSKGKLPEPASFINNVPHVSFVWGEKNVAFLKKKIFGLEQATII